MLFETEIVKKGQVDRFGQPVTGNMDETVHVGAELSATAKVNKNFSLTLNGSYSKNHISKGKRYIKFKNKKTGAKEVTALNLNGNPIAGFPNVTFNAIAKFKFRNFFASLTAKYVGEFYSDNFGEKLTSYLNDYPGFVSYKDNKVDAYFVSNLLLRYTLNEAPFFDNVKLFLQVNNIFNNLYAAYAIGGEFFPAAERNFLAGITLGW